MICPSCQAENEPAATNCFTCGLALTPVIRMGSIVASRYEVQGVLGAGGMGTVYKARDRLIGGPVAVKVLRADVSRKPEMIRRFRSETGLAQKVRHPNVCRIHGSGEDGGLLYTAMEFVEGQDLKRRILSSGGFTPEYAFDLAIQLAEALQALHDGGIVHRDVKSTNIMVDARGNPKLMDFDVAKHWEIAETGSTTTTGQFLGTPDYMSPEYARGERVDFRSDTYSLGVVIYEMFTGRLPLKGDTAIATIMKHLHEAPPLRGPKAEKIPLAMVPVLEKALAKVPDRRYAPARGFASAILAARTQALGQPIAPPAAKEAPLPALLGALNPVDGTVRIQVPEFLRKRKTDPTATKAIPVLLGALDEGEERGDPSVAAVTLPGIPAMGRGPATPVGILIEALKAPDSGDRARAARALGSIGPAAKQAIPVLLEALRDREEKVRRNAADALERMGPAAAAALASAVNDKDEVVRQIAREALARIIKRKRDQK